MLHVCTHFIMSETIKQNQNPCDMQLSNQKPIEEKRQQVVKRKNREGETVPRVTAALADLDIV